MSMEMPSTATADAAPPLRVEGLFKSFGSNVAVANMSFAVPAGACAGIVGPNGSGKSTTLRAIVGLVAPDQGRIVVCGHEVTNPENKRAALLAARREVGVVMDPLRLFDSLSAREFLRTIAELRSLDRATAESRASDLFRVLELDEDADRAISGYSHGMRKKTALAAALIHRPRLLLLDEPFEGVDPVSARTIRSMLDRYRAGGGTVVLSSHVMEIVERLCDYVVVVARGTALTQGNTDELRGGRRLEEVFIDVVGAVDTDVSALDWLG